MKHFAKQQAYLRKYKHENTKMFQKQDHRSTLN